MSITLQQALFGYDEGHQLIAASTVLPIDAKHGLSVATDLSGSPPPHGFEQVFTGMPVIGTEFYALFSTWLAEEMPRPGCVWSHVLLIELADLAQVPNLSELRGLFIRPENGKKQQFSEPIIFTPKSGFLSPLPMFSRNECVEFFRKIYGSPEAPAVFLSTTSGKHEDLIFAIWSQQWPKLRRSFAFSTGSFADRGRSGPTFDLQIIPTSNTGAWRSSKFSPLDNLQPTPVDLLGFDQSWINTGIDDLFLPNECGFRSFLQTHGADSREPRAAFSRLAKAFQIVNFTTTEWSEKLTLVGELFPTPSEALRLKESLVITQKNISIHEQVTQAWQIVTFLFSDPRAEAFGGVTLDHDSMTQILWGEKTAEMIRFLGDLIRRDENPSAKAFVEAIASRVTVQDLKMVSDLHSELIPIIIGHCHILAFDPATWHLPSYVRSHVFDVLDRLKLSQQEWAQILGAMMTAMTNVPFRQVVERAGPFAMRGALQWLQLPIAEESLPSESWRHALSFQAEKELLKSEDLSPTPLSLCAWCVSPEKVCYILNATRGDVQRLADLPLENIPRPLRTATAFMLMTLGLKTRDRAGVALITRSFYSVHEALASRNYSSEHWELLSNELPYLGIWRDWDRCEKLRKAVEQWFQKHLRSRKLLLSAAKNEYERTLAARVLNLEKANE